MSFVGVGFCVAKKGKKGRVCKQKQIEHVIAGQCGQ